MNVGITILSSVSPAALLQWYSSAVALRAHIQQLWPSVSSSVVSVTLASADSGQSLVLTTLPLL